MIQLMPNCTARILDMESNPIIFNQRNNLTQNYDAILCLSVKASLHGFESKPATNSYVALQKLINFYQPAKQR